MYKYACACWISWLGLVLLWGTLVKGGLEGVGVVVGVVVVVGVRAVIVSLVAEPVTAGVG